MERTKQKSKKEKPNKYLDKEKSSSFISDVKAFKENLKIREILKTVKMNSSMRIKAPRGSKVMQNKDFNDNEDIFDDVVGSRGQLLDQPLSATNTVLNNENESEKVHKESIEEEEIVPMLIENTTDNASSVFQKSKSLSEGIDDCSKGTPNTPEFLLPQAESAGAKSRDRKLSLDHTMLLRREGLSQSEVDLNSIGKSPLERKSSFFRKKMDSFVRNTTEIFKRQSMSSKSPRSPSTSRRDSTCSRMSVSLQSLNEDSTFFEEFKNVPLNTYRDQQSSVSSLATPSADSSLSIHVNDRLLEQIEVDTMVDSRLPEDQLADTPSTSTHSLNKEPIQDSLLTTRAISMSSGLDTATGQRRRKTSRSNRVSWLASESLTDYFRRLIQDEKSTDVQAWQSYQDFSTIPENRVGSKMDSKGRRLSYMRAVSGEDPSLASSFRKKKLMESEVLRRVLLCLFLFFNFFTMSNQSLFGRVGQPDPVPVRPPTELERLLIGFSKQGIPPLANYTPPELQKEVHELMKATTTNEGFNEHFPKRRDLTPFLGTQQEILQEMVVSESQYLQHLEVIINVYMATLHSIQKNGHLLDIVSWMLFSRTLDVYNSAVKFWEIVFYPMLSKAKSDGTLLDPNLIIPGFGNLCRTLLVYEEYLQDQTSCMNYIRDLKVESDFACYLNWCNQQTTDRLQLQDLIIKPMQRLTKYELYLSRLKSYVEDKETVKELDRVAREAKKFLTYVNRAMRLREEVLKVDEMLIEPFEPEYKGDEEVENLCKKYATIDLHQPMIDCGTVRRCLIYQGNVRYKDSIKEFDAHVLLFTDMMLICKKLPKVKEKDKNKNMKTYSHWKMLRPKIMLTRLLPSSKKNSLVYVILDELGSTVTTFQLYTSSKQSLGNWEQKINEAMVTYVLTKWYTKNPPRILDEVAQQMFTIPKSEKDIVSEIEKHARNRVAAMLHVKMTFQEDLKRRRRVEFILRLVREYKNKYPFTFQNVPFTRLSTTTKPTVTSSTVKRRQRRSSMAAAMACGLKGKAGKHAKGERSTPNLHEILETGIDHKKEEAEPARNLSTMTFSPYGRSCGRSKSDINISSGFHDAELYRSGSALENRSACFDGGITYLSGKKAHLIPEINTQTLEQSSRSVVPPSLVVHESSPNHSPGPRSASADDANYSNNTLRVASDASLVTSMPNIHAEIRRVISESLEPKPTPPSASERLYRSHQELMHRNRIAAGQHYLKPDSRGSSYPPPSPRALQRSEAVSFTFRYPPLTRTRNVPERSSTTQLESTRWTFGRRSPQHNMASGSKSPRRQRSPSPVPQPAHPLVEKPDKRQKSLFLRRNKGFQTSPENDESYIDDRSRHSSQEKQKQRVGSNVAEDVGGSSTTDDQDSAESLESPKKSKEKK